MGSFNILAQLLSTRFFLFKNHSTLLLIRPRQIGTRHPPGWEQTNILHTLHIYKTY